MGNKGARGDGEAARRAVGKRGPPYRSRRFKLLHRVIVRVKAIVWEGGIGVPIPESGFLARYRIDGGLKGKQRGLHHQPQPLVTRLSWGVSLNDTGGSNVRLFGGLAIYREDRLERRRCFTR